MGDTEVAARPVGRPTAYRDGYPEQAYKLAMLGLTDAQIAEFFEISKQTLYDWQAAHPEFLDSITRGKVPADAEVAISLYKRANGYSHEAVKIFLPPGATEPIYAKYTEHYPPDTPAASLWLRNRQKALWRDTQSLQNLDKNGNPTDGPRKVVIEIVGIPTPQLAAEPPSSRRTSDAHPIVEIDVVGANRRS